MSIYLKMALGLLAVLLIGYGVRTAYITVDANGYDRKSKEVAEEVIALREERDKYLREFTLFKEAAKATLELKIAANEKAYLDGVDYGKAQANAAIADIPRSGLSVNIQADDTSAGNCPTAPTSNIPSSTETKRAKLSAKDAEFFISFANEADDTVKQLTACQKDLMELTDYMKLLLDWAAKNSFIVK